MRNLTENMKLEALRNAGYDVDKYDYTEIVVLTPKEVETAKSIVEDKQLNNKKLFRRWVTAQTFRMLDGKSWNPITREYESGWDACLKNNYSYQYQFTMMLEELRVLNKLEARDKEAFTERVHFFNKDVVVKTCEDYIYELKKYINSHQIKETKTHINSNNETTTDTKLYMHVGRKKLHISKVNKTFVDNQLSIIEEMKSAESYAELYALLKLFMKNMIKLDIHTRKSSAWKDAFKGIGAYETLKNMILFHDVVLRGCDDKKSSMDKLTACLDSYKGEGWRFHAMLKDTIAYNNFDLKRSIELHK